jgi:hypothetical protein
MPLHRLGDATEERLKILVLPEQLQPAIGAIENMIHLPAGSNACNSWHG